MSARGERTLVQHLLDPDSLRVIATEGFDDEMIPSEIVRHMVKWSLSYWYQSGRIAAPSLEAFRSVEVEKRFFGDVVDDMEIDMSMEPEDTIEWALQDLASTWVAKTTNEFVKDFATGIAGAMSTDRVSVVDQFASKLVGISMRFTRRSEATELAPGMADRLHEYDQRALANGALLGASMGLPEVDAYTSGIQDGELAILAAPPKTGKSYMAAKIALSERERGRRVALFTLENSVGMTLDRMACLATGVDSTRWQQGRCSDEEREAIRLWSSSLEEEETIWVLQPELGKRSIEQMVREAQIREADTLIIDQLTFVELPNPRKPRHERIGEGLHLLKGMISTGRDRMPCFLAHQVNREGAKAADKAGYLEMHHMAESAEVERTADWVFGLYASPDERTAQQLKLQTLAARRAPLRHWRLNWQVGRGNISIRQQIEIN